MNNASAFFSNDSNDSNKPLLAKKSAYTSTECKEDARACLKGAAIGGGTGAFFGTIFSYACIATAWWQVGAGAAVGASVLGCLGATKSVYDQHKDRASNNQAPAAQSSMSPSRRTS